jgi:hypothetical protein
MVDIDAHAVTITTRGRANGAAGAAFNAAAVL